MVPHLYALPLIRATATACSSCSLLTLLGGLLFHGLGEMAGTGGTRPAVAWLVSGLVLLANLLVLHKFLRIVLSGVWSILHGPSSSLSRQY